MRGKWTIFISEALILFGFWHNASGAQDANDAKTTYALYCSGCHGKSGQGDGPLGSSLPVKPANHADGRTMNRLSDDFLREIISKGGGSVGKSPVMPAWGGQLKEKQIAELVAYIRSLAVPVDQSPHK